MLITCPCCLRRRLAGRRRPGARYGLERTLFGALLLIAAGIVGRSLGSEAALYAGTVVIGAGIALATCCCPAWSSAIFRGAWPADLGLCADHERDRGRGSAVAIPLAALSDATWRFSALCLLAVPALGALLWLPQLSRRTRVRHGARRTASGWGSALAWQVTLFLGINSFVFYDGELAAGDPAGCRLHGGAGRLAAWPAAADVGGAGAVPGAGRARMKDQRAVAAGAAGASCVAMIGLIVAPGWASLWIVLMGLGMGAGIILGLAFVGLRARHAQQAASLSGMAQFVGYLLAASGPLLIGALHDALGGWSAALALCAAACGRWPPPDCTPAAPSRSARSRPARMPRRRGRLAEPIASRRPAPDTGPPAPAIPLPRWPRVTGRCQHRVLRAEHIDEVRRALGITALGMQQRLARAGRRAFQAGPRLLLATIGRHGVVDIVPGAEHGFLECQRCLWACASRSRSRPRSLPPSKRESAAPGPRRRCRRGRCPACPVAAPAADVARQGDARIEIALGHADRGHRGMQAPAPGGCRDAARPARWAAHRHPHRTARDGRQRFQPRVQRVRRLVQQQRQGVHQLVHAHASGGTAASMAAAWASAWDTSSSVATPSRAAAA